MNKTTEVLREKAKNLLTDGSVKVVIGYELLPNDLIAPAFITKPEDCEKLIFNEKCYQNLTTYLTKPEVKDLGHPAIISKGCDNRAINVLIRESQIKREDVYILGVECPGMDKSVCAWCDQFEPVTYDELIKLESPPQKSEPVEDHLKDKSPEEKWEYWLKEFSRCIKCYACRQICPICHCVRCAAENNHPQWIDSSPHPRGNLKWNLIRAFHLAGRCVECGECERACPMEIPLSSLSRSMKELVQEKFEFVPGMNSENTAPLASFKEDDKEDFFK